MKWSKILQSERERYHQWSERNFMIFGFIWLVLFIDLMVIVLAEPEHLTFFSWAGILLLIFLGYLALTSSQEYKDLRDSADDLLVKFRLKSKRSTKR